MLYGYAIESLYPDSQMPQICSEAIPGSLAEYFITRYVLNAESWFYVSEFNELSVQSTCHDVLTVMTNLLFTTGCAFTALIEQTTQAWSLPTIRASSGTMLASKHMTRVAPRGAFQFIKTKVSTRTSTCHA